MIGIFSFLSLRYAQFAYKYTNILDENGIEYEFIHWNRDNVKNLERDNWISYDYKLNSFQPFYKKIIGFIRFSNFMKKKISERKFEKLIILTSQTAIPLFNVLRKKYKNLYIYDYRDVTYENNFIYKKIVNELVNNSYCTCISSKGFEKNLYNKKKLIMSHNTRDFEPKTVEKKKSEKIRIVYWGMVRQLEYNYKICDLFSKDDRFELSFHGAGYHKELKNYCEQHNYNNIKITGEYDLNEIDSFAENTDIILNCYENDRRQGPAMTVKFYDSLQYRIPMIINKDCYMEQLVNEFNLGFVLDIDDKTALDKLFEEYTKFDFDRYHKQAEKLALNIMNDNNEFKYKLIQFAKGE